MHNLYTLLEIPEKDQKTSVSREEAEFIYRFLSENQLIKTLEVGFAYGCSAAHIVSATKSKHVVIDPHQDYYDRLGEKNLEKLGFIEHISLIEDYSHNALPEFLKQKRSFDFAFIDGDHRFDAVFNDFFYIDKLLNTGGYVLFHDQLMDTVKSVLSWIKNNKQNYQFQKTGVKNLALVKKIGEDQRGQDDHKPFFTGSRLSIGGIGI